MPDVNGYEAYSHIKKSGRKVPVIAQTAYALSGEREQILDAGFDDYISKPIKQDILLKVVSRFLI
jgi:two-component system, cell cycle response regulator DivK